MSSVIAVIAKNTTPLSTSPFRLFILLGKPSQYQPSIHIGEALLLSPSGQPYWLGMIAWSLTYMRIKKVVMDDPSSVHNDLDNDAVAHVYMQIMVFIFFL